MKNKTINVKNVIKKVAIIMLVGIIVSTSFLPIYAASLPTFAVVDKNTSKVYKTEESSIKSVTNVSFNFQSQSQILMEASTGKILYTNNENEKLLPASVTKIMTLLLIMESIDSGKISYSDKVTCSANAASMGGSQIWFKEGEQLTVEEALKCICVVSANDVSVAMSELIGGSEENFVNMMNEKAKALGMTNTNFMNPHGIDQTNHYTTAKDIAIMSKELITKHPNILKYTSIWMDTIRGGEFGLSNTNKILKTYDGANGLKTGSTSQALFNLSATATKNNMTLIAVVMKAPTSAIRNDEVTELLNYGFANYAVKELSKKGDIVASTKINKYISKNVNILFENDENLVVPKGTKIEVTKEVNFNKNISAPIMAGTKVGTVKFINQNKELVKEVDIVINQDIQKSNMLAYFKKTMGIFGVFGLKESA